MACSKCKSRKTARRRKMYGRGQTASFLTSNLNSHDALAVALASLYPLVSYFSPPDMRAFLEAEQFAAKEAHGDVTEVPKAYLIQRLNDLRAKYSAQPAAAAPPLPPPPPPPLPPVPPAFAPAPAPYQAPPLPAFPPMGRSVSAPAAISAGRRRVTRRRPRRPRRR